MAKSSHWGKFLMQTGLQGLAVFLMLYASLKKRAEPKQSEGFH
jgi:hypothetical protein